MYLQGNLQAVFDALYEMGMIEPVLEMDWSEAMNKMQSHPEVYQEVVQVVNSHSQFGTQYLVQELSRFSEATLSYLAMEVAREFADFHSRDQVH